MIRRYISSLTGESTVTTDARLRLSVIVGGSFIGFEAQLDRPIDANITINRIFADNFPNCSLPAQGSIQQNVPQVIPAGSTGLMFGYQLLSGTVNSSNSRVYNTIINSLAVTNGIVLTIGSFNVTISLQQCGELP